MAAKILDHAARFALIAALGTSACAQQPSIETPPAWVSRPVSPVAKLVTPGRHIVKPGDTLSRIAATSGAPLEAIAAANGLVPPYSVRIGQVLIIPAGRYHTLKRGETGIAIARAYGVAWREIIEINKLAEPFLLREGQRLLLPQQALAAPASPAPTLKPSSPAAPAMAIEQRASAFKLDIDDIVTGGEPALASSAKPAQPSVSPARTPPPSVPVAAPTGTFVGGFSWPVTGKILRPFGDFGNGRRNDGINIAAAKGTPILAAADGVVAYVGTDVAIYGGLVLIRHADGWITAYGHAAAILVKRGQSVKKGQQIASVDDANLDEEDQLHFQIRQGRTPVDPIGRLAAR